MGIHIHFHPAKQKMQGAQPRRKFQKFDNQLRGHRPASRMTSSQPRLDKGHFLKGGMGGK